MELRAFGVCRTCSEVYPSARGCPHCDGDAVAAAQVRAARAVAVASAAEAPSPAGRVTPAHVLYHAPGWQWKPVVAIVSVSLVLSTLIAVLVQV